MMSVCRSASRATPRPQPRRAAPPLPPPNLSQVRVPRVLWDALASGMYRAIPQLTIAGESRTFPFASDDDDDE